MLQSPSSSIESRASWVVATVALCIMGMSFGASWITAVALKDIAAEIGGTRSIPALASALAWLGSGIGGIAMGRIAERIGTRWTAMFGALMIGVGLTLSTYGPPWPLWIGHGLFIGLIGLGGINAPLYAYAGWRQTMLWYAAIEIVVVVPLAAIYFRHPPEVVYPAVTPGSSNEKARVLSLIHISEPTR